MSERLSGFGVTSWICTSSKSGGETTTAPAASEPKKDEGTLPGSTYETAHPVQIATPPGFVNPGLNPDSQWQISNIGKSPTISSAVGTEQATGIFLVFTVTVQNNSAKEQSVEKVSNLIKVYDSQKREYLQSDKRFILPEAFKNESLAPGGSISRTAVFDVSPDAAGLVVRVHGWSIAGQDTAYVQLGI